MLILSRFAGAARQLSSALLVNPHDPDELADAMDKALTMSLAERQERWQVSWRAIETNTPMVWGRSFLTNLARASTAATPDPSVASPSAAEPVTTEAGEA